MRVSSCCSFVGRSATLLSRDSFSSLTGGEFRHESGENGTVVEEGSF